MTLPTRQGGPGGQQDQEHGVVLHDQEEGYQPPITFRSGSRWTRWTARFKYLNLHNLSHLRDCWIALSYDTILATWCLDYCLLDCLCAYILIWTSDVWTIDNWTTNIWSTDYCDVLTTKQQKWFWHWMEGQIDRSTDYDFAANVSDFASIFSRLFFNEIASNILRIRDY